MAEPKQPPTIYAVLEDKVMSLKDLQTKVPALAISVAWATGDIEFGRRSHVHEGPVGRTGSSVIVETTTEWTGPKTKYHRAYREFVNDPLPDATYFRRPDIPREKVTDPASGAEYTQMGKISKSEAHELLVIMVKLTDQGLAKLPQPNAVAA